MALRCTPAKLRARGRVSKYALGAHSRLRVSSALIRMSSANSSAVPMFTLRAGARTRDTRSPPRLCTGGVTAHW